LRLPHSKTGTSSVIGTSSSWYKALAVVILEDLGPIGCGER
jgi:hypothetical protein